MNIPSGAKESTALDTSPEIPLKIIDKDGWLFWKNGSIDRDGTIRNSRIVDTVAFAERLALSLEAKMAEDEPMDAIFTKETIEKIIKEENKRENIHPIDLRMQQLAIRLLRRYHELGEEMHKVTEDYPDIYDIQ